MFTWEYVVLLSGRLCYADGLADCNSNWPDFASAQDAEKFLEAQDVRATIIPMADAVELEGD